jgi:hypothetical protein
MEVGQHTSCKGILCDVGEKVVLQVDVISVCPLEVRKPLVSLMEGGIHAL